MGLVCLFTPDCSFDGWCYFSPSQYLARKDESLKIAELFGAKEQNSSKTGMQTEHEMFHQGLLNKSPRGEAKGRVVPWEREKCKSLLVCPCDRCVQGAKWARRLLQCTYHHTLSLVLP